MNRNLLRWVLGAVVLVASLGLLAWSGLPSRQVVRRQSFQPAEMRPATSAQAAPAIPETRILTLAYPATVRIGAGGRVQLTFAPETAFPDLPSVYATYNVLAEARLDMAGVRPADIVSEPLLPGQKVTFYWDLQPRQAGEYEGTVWFYLRFVPKAGGEDIIRQPLWAQAVDVEAVSLGQIPPKIWQLLGLMGLLVGVLLAWPFAWRVVRRLVGRKVVD